jgi:LuxR family maltose regulon positive regulatory protein
VALHDVASADRSCENALQEGLAGGAYYIVAGTYYIWAMIARRQGRLRDAAKACRQGLEAVTATSDEGVPQPPSAGLLHLVLGGILLEWGDLEAAEGTLTEALEMIELTAEKESLVSGHATLAHLCQVQGKSARALDAIQKIESLLPENRSYGAALRANLQLREAARDPGQLQAALQWSEACALELDAEQDLPAILSQGEWPYAEQLTLARVRIAQARGMNAPAEQSALQSVLDFLEAQIRIAAARGWNERVIEMTVLKALALDAQGDTEGVIPSLHRALTMGEAQGYLRLFVDEGAPMGRLLYTALSRDILPQYVGKLLAAFSDAQPTPFISAESSTPSRRAGRKQPDELVEPLSEREIEVLELIAQGLSNREVAHRLTISLNTVKGHTTNIYGKLGVASRTHATAKARMIGLLPPG